MDNFWPHEIFSQSALSWNSLMKLSDNFWPHEITSQSRLSWNSLMKFSDKFYFIEIFFQFISSRFTISSIAYQLILGLSKRLINKEELKSFNKSYIVASIYKEKKLLKNIFNYQYSSLEVHTCSCRSELTIPGIFFLFIYQVWRNIMQYDIILCNIWFMT